MVNQNLQLGGCTWMLTNQSTMPHGDTKSALLAGAVHAERTRNHCLTKPRWSAVGADQGRQGQLGFGSASENYRPTRRGRKEATQAKRGMRRGGNI